MWICCWCFPWFFKSLWYCWPWYSVGQIRSLWNQRLCSFLFKNYLSCRTQYVTYDGSESNWQIIKCGVPQGSILGPLLFLIYINDLCTVCKNTMPVQLADDTNLFCSGLDATGIQDGVNHDLAIITEWPKANKLSLNIKRHITCVY